MPRAGASARAQEKVALQSEVMPNSLSKEADAARKREKRGAEREQRDAAPEDGHVGDDTLLEGAPRRP